MRSAALLRRTNPIANHALFVKNVGFNNSGQASATTLVITVPAGGVPAGHTLIVRSASDFISSGPTIADSRSNTYTSVRSAAGTGSSMRASIYSCQVSTALLAGDTITLTWSSALTNRAAVIDEFQGLLVPLTVDGQNGSSSTSATPDISVVATNAVDLVVAALGSIAPLTDSYTQDAAWSGLTRTGTSPGSGPYISIGGAYRLTKSTNTWHYKPVLGASTTWVGLSVAFKAT